MFLLSARAVFRFEIDQHLKIAVKVQKPDTGRGGHVYTSDDFNSFKLSQHCKNQGSRITAAFSLLLIMWACNKPIKPIDTDERQHIILSKKLVNCIPSADCDQALISYLLQLKSHYSSFSINRVRWVQDGECSELSNCSDLSRKKNWLRLPLNPQQVSPLEVMKTKRRVLMRNIKSSGLCNKHDWFEAGNPLEQKCGTISTVAILFVLILGTTRYVISTIASAVCFYCSPLVENIEVQDLRSYAAFIMNMC